MIERRYKMQFDVNQNDLVQFYYALKARGAHLLKFYEEVWNALPLETQQALKDSAPEKKQ